MFRPSPAQRADPTLPTTRARARLLQYLAERQTLGVRCSLVCAHTFPAPRGSAASSILRWRLGCVRRGSILTSARACGARIRNGCQQRLFLLASGVPRLSNLFPPRAVDELTERLLDMNRTLGHPIRSPRDLGPQGYPGIKGKLQTVIEDTRSSPPRHGPSLWAWLRPARRLGDVRGP